MKALDCPAVAQLSRIGAREINEDRLGHWSTPGATLMAVADGLGGHLHGELAAQIAIDVLGAAFAEEARDKLADPPVFLTRTMALAHVAIQREAARHRLAEIPRTVLVACLVQDGEAFCAHVGDCRFYLVRQGRIALRSRDHTVVQRLIDEGRIAESVAAVHPYRNRLLRCLGSQQFPAVETAAAVRLAPDDILLLCSDGLWGPLTPDELARTLASLPLEAALLQLAALAEKRAGAACDNISAVALTWQPAE